MYVSSTLKIVNLLSTRKFRFAEIFQNTFLLLIAFTIWFIGSLIVIQIDLGRKIEILDISFQNQLDVQMELIDSYCRSMERKELAKVENSKEDLNVLVRAKREKIVRENLIFIPDLNQMWCLVPKAASTTWSTILLARLNLKGSDIPVGSTGQNYTPNQVILKQKFGYTNKITFENTVRDEKVKKVLLVRHPFARIMSAYENKLKNRKETPDGQYFFQNYGAMIYRKYRKDRRLKQREPTFAEFIDYLIDTDPLNYDEHWQPIFLMCGLCNVYYNIVIKTEDLPNISNFLLRKLGIGFSNYKLLRQNMNKGVSKISEYYSNISKSKMVLLFRKYEEDFRLFNYSYHEFVPS